MRIQGGPAAAEIYVQFNLQRQDDKMLDSFAASGLFRCQHDGYLFEDWANRYVESSRSVRRHDFDYWNQIIFMLLSCKNKHKASD